MYEIILATNNENKVKEINAIFKGVKIVSLKEAGVVSDVEETGKTFEENAFLKARAAYALTGKPSLGDDSGLSVLALGGRPGIYSARYAGVHGDAKANNAKLLAEMKDVTDRRAEFVCAAAFVCEKGEFVFVGKAQGEVLYEEKGTGGFNYDPLFYSYELKKSFGEASAAEKNSVSHRARAMLGLREILIKEGIIER